MSKPKTQTFFTSDLHIGHHKVLEYCSRPFGSLHEMEEKLIANWNSVVRPDDTVYVLGDFLLGGKPERIREVIGRLNGLKILIRGNHDAEGSRMKALGFDVVLDHAVMKIAGEQVNLSHFPYRMNRLKELYYEWGYKLFPKRFFRPRKFYWQLKNDGKFLLHGHTHSKHKIRGKMIHVGVDAWDFKPVSIGHIGNIIELIKRGK